MENKLLYLEGEGGFAYTIEDPPELPLDGIR